MSQVSSLMSKSSCHWPLAGARSPRTRYGDTETGNDDRTYNCNCASTPSGRTTSIRRRPVQPDRQAPRRVKYGQDKLIETLHLAQDVFGYLDDGILLYLATALRLPPSRVYGVATFYHLFTFDPPGDHSCTVCTGTPAS